MSQKQLFKPILRMPAKLLTWLVAFFLLSSIAPARLFAQTPVTNPQTATQQTACAAARQLTLDTPLARDGAQRTQPAEWLKFTVQQNNRYRLAVNNAAGLQLAIYDRCDPGASTAELHNGALEFTATRDGDYYLRVRPDGVASAGIAGYQVSLAAAAPHRPNAVPLADVPEAVQRRALEFLEEMRGSDLAPEWLNARVNPQARILYRPDLQTAAYYEFAVEKPLDNGFEPAGFIQLAAGEHDYPVTHWDVTSMSPVQELAEIAPLNTTLTEFYKVDALSYAAEYEEITPLGLTTVATDVINIGDLPRRIGGLEMLPLAPAELAGNSVDSAGNIENEGPEELPLSEQTDWESWAALKTGYEEEYGPLLASLQQNASTAWELQKQLDQHGESLVTGDVRTVYGLPSQTIAAINITGDGAATAYLQQETVSTNGAATGVKLTVLAEPADATVRLPFTVTLQYTGGTTETVHYAIVSALALNINQMYLPLIVSGGSNQVSSANAQATAGDWGPWHYWWADGDAGSNQYGQMSAHSAPNTSGCASGCGGTAWAMLFGWVDRRAGEGHANWVNHWGIYRQNGGLGANVVAPLHQDGGVKEMTWQIRNQIGTFCIGNSGATWPWEMIDAADYVRPRATAAWRMQTKYDPTGLCWLGACNGNRDLAKDAIINRRQPAIVGTGWLQHYPVAYGYAERSRRSCILFICWTDHSRWFYVNNGWYGRDNGWTSADVWFAGSYFRN